MHGVDGRGRLAGKRREPDCKVQHVDDRRLRALVHRRQRPRLLRHHEQLHLPLLQLLFRHVRAGPRALGQGAGQRRVREPFAPRDNGDLGPPALGEAALFHGHRDGVREILQRRDGPVRRQLSKHMVERPETQAEAAKEDERNGAGSQRQNPPLG